MAVKYEDYYQVLGVKRQATQAEIQRAYRKRARQYHPDVNKQSGAQDKLARINEAYEVLTDSDKRAAYDRRLGNLFPPNLTRGLGSSWNHVYIIVGLAILVLIAARLGIRVALVLAVGAVVIWLVGKIGK